MPASEKAAQPAHPFSHHFRSLSSLTKIVVAIQSGIKSFGEYIKPHPNSLPTQSHFSLYFQVDAPRAVCLCSTSTSFFHFFTASHGFFPFSMTGRVAVLAWKGVYPAHPQSANAGPRGGFLVDDRRRAASATRVSLSMSRRVNHRELTRWLTRPHFRYARPHPISHRTINHLYVATCQLHFLLKPSCRRAWASIASWRRPRCLSHEPSAGRALFSLANVHLLSTCFRRLLVVQPILTRNLVFTMPKATKAKRGEKKKTKKGELLNALIMNAV